MRLRGLILVFFLVSLIALVGCTPAEEAGGSSSDKEEKANVEKEEERDYKAEGEAVGKEILDTYDAAVAEVAEALKDKPEPAEAKELIKAVMESYKPKMEALAEKKVALLDVNIRCWGAVNSYLGENRGKRVFNKDHALTEFMNYYTLQKPDEELTKMLSSTITSLIDVADAPNPNY